MGVQFPSPVDATIIEHYHNEAFYSLRPTAFVRFTDIYVMKCAFIHLHISYDCMRVFFVILAVKTDTVVISRRRRDTASV